MRLSVIIPVYNGKDHLPTCLKALHQATEKARESLGISTEIVAVDDASTDESARFIEESWPMLRLLRNNENRGFAASVNRGH